jgi:exodeoxyribonuclease VII small subunit
MRRGVKEKRRSGQLVEKMSFEDALGRLEGIVSRLEDGNVTLEEALKAFEDGVSLVKLCSRRLQQAEKKAQRLSQETLEILEPTEPDPESA